MIESPCKKCNKWQDSFPGCFDGCEVLHSLQQQAVNKKKDSYSTGSDSISEEHSILDSMDY